MKKFILNFKLSIRFLVTLIACREFAFCYCMLGTIAQVAHTFFLIESISSLNGGWRTTQAIMLSVFISSSLLFFTAISDNEDTEDSKKIHFAITLFTIIEILINVYYYTKHLLLDKIDVGIKYNVFDFVFAVIISALIPITIKLYSSNIRAKEWMIEIEESDKIENNKESDNNLDKNLEEIPNYNLLINEEINNSLKELTPQITKNVTNFVKTDINQELEIIKNDFSSQTENIINGQIENIDNQISQSFERNQDLFLKQFENKTKLLIQNKLEQLK